MSELFTLRPGRESDHGFVIDSWCKANMCAPRAREMLSAGVYWTEYKPRVRRHIELYKLTIAHDPDDPDAILGWAVTSRLEPPDNFDPLIHYCYVRGARGKAGRGARRCGIATALLGPYLNHECTITHRPANGRVPIPEKWFFNPERFYR